jgi:FkbH-like protein
VAQLTQRSNQFNLRTIRYNEADIRRMSVDDNYVCLAFHLSDKFGDYGLISVVILYKTNTHTLFIDTWLMSCRVLKRGVEQFVMNKIVETAAALQVKTITAEYIPSGKNEMVKDLLSNMQFAKKDHQYELSISNYLPLKHFISQIDQTPSSIE